MATTDPGEAEPKGPTCKGRHDWRLQRMTIPSLGARTPHGAVANATLMARPSACECVYEYVHVSVCVSGLRHADRALTSPIVLRSTWLPLPVATDLPPSRRVPSTLRRAGTRTGRRTGGSTGGAGGHAVASCHAAPALSASCHGGVACTGRRWVARRQCSSCSFRNQKPGAASTYQLLPPVMGTSPTRRLSRAAIGCAGRIRIQSLEGGRL